MTAAARHPILPPPRLPGSAARRMALALTLAIALHSLLLLALGLKLPAPAPIRSGPLEVMLVTTPGARQRDPDATVAAQTDRAGETVEALPDTPELPAPADTEDAELPAAEPPTPDLSEPAPEIAKEPPAASEPPAAAPEPPVEPAPESAPEPDPVLTAIEPPEPEPIPEPEPDPIPEAEPPPAEPLPAVSAADILASRGAEIQRLTARIQAQGSAYASRARRKAISTSTREYRYASYMEAWRRKVENIGNLNYPEEAKRRGLYGNLILHVAIRADGSLEQARVVRSSGQPLLDEAAVRIVELAAPFAPFPPDIRAETDILDITRTWQFQRNNRLGWEN